MVLLTGDILLESRAKRLATIYAAADPATRKAGREWYPRAGRLAAEIAAEFDYPPKVAAAVIAVLSPQVTWAENLQLARDAFAAKRNRRPLAGTFGRNLAKAAAIIDGEPIADNLGARAPKVRAFFANICGRRDAVTVDRWAARAADGRETFAELRGRNYDAYADAYRRAAELVGVPPRTLQATVWVAVRGKSD
jgi:hypothetical protein